MKANAKKYSSTPNGDPRNSIYHFKIYLLNISPMVYRRFKVKGDVHLATFHHLIQIIMGWDNIHLHCFKIWGFEYGMVHTGITAFFDDPFKIFIADLDFRVGDKFEYNYDFGDDWEHEIRIKKIESINTKYKFPTCTEGMRACPPEECGGPFFYEEALVEQERWQQFMLDKIRRSIREKKLPVIDDESMPLWYTNHQSEIFDRKKINKIIEKVYQEKSDDNFWWKLKQYDPYRGDN